MRLRIAAPALAGALLVATTVLAGAVREPRARPSIPASVRGSRAPRDAPVGPESVASGGSGSPVLRVDRPVVRPGTCASLLVRAPAATAAVRIVGVRPALRVPLRAGRGRTRLCPPWTGDRQLRLRAIGSGGAPSDPVVLVVRPTTWMLALDRLLGRLPVSVTVGGDAEVTYARRGALRRRPASNEKLLLSMALLDRFGPSHRLATTAGARAGARHGAIVRGDLFLVGHGDPAVGTDTLARLAAAIRRAGIRRVTGSVVGVTSTFSRGRWAPGWRPIALRFVSIPTALVFEGNQDAGGFVFDPERRAAAALTTDLRADGVRVGGAPEAGPAGAALRAVTRVRSAPLVELLRRQNVESRNLDAEVLAKVLGAATTGRGTTRAGADAIRRWAARLGVHLVAEDGSGLSYRDRVSTDGLVRLLTIARRSPWGASFRSTLARPGEGTLAGRLAGVPVLAKTGTLLRGVSALSGYVRTTVGWTPFSILSDGLSKDRAVALEDAVVRLLATT